MCIPYFPKFKFVRVCSLVGRYICNVYVEQRLKLCFFLKIKDINICA